MHGVVIITSVILSVVEIFLSIQLILRKKNKYASIIEIILSYVVQLLYLFALHLKWWKIIEYVLVQYAAVKVFLVLFMIVVRKFGFYCIKRLAKEKRQNRKTWFSRKFGTSKRLRAIKRINQINYFPRLKLGLPGMANQVHGVTKVHFDSKGFPIFKSKYKVKLKITDYRQSRSYHFLICNKKLYKDVRTNTRLRQKLNLSKNDIKALEIGETPKNYVWHHHQNPGVLQLVDRKTHEKTFHKGGFSIWGGKDN